MKMGTIVSPWRYDAAAGRALRPHDPGYPAIFRYRLAGGGLSDFAGWSGYPTIAAFLTNPGIGAMGRKPACRTGARAPCCFGEAPHSHSHRDLIEVQRLERLMTRRGVQWMKVATVRVAPGKPGFRVSLA